MFIERQPNLIDMNNLFALRLTLLSFMVNVTVISFTVFNKNATSA